MIVFFQIVKHCRYRFSVLINELSNSPADNYTTALLSLITTLLDGHDEQPEGEDITILNELLGMSSVTLLLCPDYFLEVFAGKSAIETDKHN